MLAWRVAVDNQWWEGLSANLRVALEAGIDGADGGGATTGTAA
jgi:hypothetical protein